MGAIPCRFKSDRRHRKYLNFYGRYNTRKIKKEKRKLKKDDIIGFIFGISIAWAIGFGVIPYIIGIFFGIWLTRKMLNSQKTYVKIIFWILFALVFIIGSIVHGLRFNSNYSYSDSRLQTEDVKLLETDKNPDTSQISGNLYRNKNIISESNFQKVGRLMWATESISSKSKF